MSGKEDFQKQILKKFKSGGIVGIPEEKIQAVTREIPRNTRFKEKIPPRYRSLRAPEHNIDTLAIFWGNVGSGKTCEAISNMEEQYVAGKINTWHWDTEMGIITMLKAGFNDGSFNKEYQRMRSIDFLIVDEMGKCNDSEFNNSLIFDILNYRYMWEKKTILICNAYSKKEVESILTPAILDRYRECSYHFDGKTQRYQDNTE